MPHSSACYVLVPKSIMKAFGGRVRVPVVVTVNGVAHRTTICDMGLGPAIGLPEPMRAAAGIARGDRIAVRVEADLKERTVDVPRDFAKAMNKAERKAYDAMAYSHRREYVQWIEDAKKPETRARRIEKAREKLRERLAVG